uniref:Secreted protein n=1 Tax=Ascaris lumbricoides TaxID=6252 RepID=A0A0M3HYW7_ASCLU
MGFTKSSGSSCIIPLSLFVSSNSNEGAEQTQTIVNVNVTAASSRLRERGHSLNCLPRCYKTPCNDCFVHSTAADRILKGFEATEKHS